MTEYRVAAFSQRPIRLTSPPGQAPEGKHHAYLEGAATTACGFGLNNMRLYADLRFSRQQPSVRCPLCARIVGADH